MKGFIWVSIRLAIGVALIMLVKHAGLDGDYFLFGFMMSAFWHNDNRIDALKRQIEQLRADKGDE